MDSYKFCYHGTIKKAGEAIQQNIDLSQMRANTDFGRGFYLTDNLEQAEYWARSRSRVSQFKGQLKEGSEPVVVYFALDFKKLGKLKNIQFNTPSKEWAEFIFHCRSKGLKEDSLYHNYDFSVGPLADGRTGTLVLNVLSEEIGLDEFWKDIQPRHQTHSQLALHTQAALACIKCIGVNQIEME